MELLFVLILVVVYNWYEWFGKIANNDNEFNYKYNKLILLRRYGKTKGEINI